MSPLALYGTDWSGLIGGSNPTVTGSSQYPSGGSAPSTVLNWQSVIDLFATGPAWVMHGGGGDVPAGSLVVWGLLGVSSYLYFNR